MTKRRLTEEEQKAWDRVRKSVRPIKSGQRSRIKRDVADNPLIQTPAPDPKPVSREKPSQAGISPVHHRYAAGLQNRGSEKKVRRGKVEVSASFDLHGHTQESAWSALPAFLIREQARGSRCVIVITGKGRLGEGVLRRNFLRWIEMPDAKALVSGYAQAHPRHGGSGAFYLFLRRR